MTNVLITHHGHGPHFLDIIKLAHFGAENVDDNIACINQHPIARFFAFDGKGWRALFFEHIGHIIRKRGYMAWGAA